MTVFHRNLPAYEGQPAGYSDRQIGSNRFWSIWKRDSKGLKN
jgi:hypothetical protein